MKKKISLMIAVILLMQIILPMLTVIWESSITLISNAEDSTEYYINSEQDLWDFAKEVNSGNTFEGITVYLTKDIDLVCSENKQWTPIGDCNVDSGNNADTTTDKTPFSGIFDGNEHEITGIYIDTTENFTGLFGYNEGTIRNLILKDSYIKSSKAYIGGISAYNKGTIDNCHNYANIISDADAGACGGIAGYSTGANILHCSNSGNIEGSNGGIAGITGYTWGTNIKECYNEGDIKTDAYMAGGITGYCQTSWIESCYNTGEIEADLFAGGITGKVYKFASVCNCYNTGKICAKSDNKDIYAGGITGTSSLAEENEYKIKNCYSVGEIVKPKVTNDRIVALGNISGQHGDGFIENCYYKQNGIGALGNNSSSVTENSIIEMKEKDIKDESMINKLNNGSDCYCYDGIKINNGYPILKFQYELNNGDANGDGIVDFKDILAINKHRLSKVKLTGEYLKAADVNGDGKVDFMDILQINKYRLGKLTSL